MKSITLIIFFIISNHILCQNFQLPPIENYSKDTIFQNESQRKGQLLVNSDSLLQFMYFENDLPNLTVFYKFNQNKYLNSIRYIWNDVIYFGETLEKTSLIKQEKLTTAYEHIVEVVTQRYGKSIQKGNMNETSNVEDLFGVYRTDEWENEKLKITTFIHICNYINQTDSIFPIKKIELVYEYKQDNNSKLSFDDYNNQFQRLLKNLKDKDYPNAKILFSNKIKNSITDDYLKNIASDINITKSLVMYHTSTQMMADGSENQIFQYKYSQDVNPKPIEFVTIVFESKSGKILSINTVKLGAE